MALGRGMEGRCSAPVAVGRQAGAAAALGGWVVALGAGVVAVQDAGCPCSAVLWRDLTGGPRGKNFRKP
ncbi:hypothetical protein OsI_32801 [Oryza sativa Indica Group]|jgi:hypothetical protein|uniref:Uncharacterized protein n=1 Tax=Oryza sativa subsp. indica TaxID=39946 RepID=B8BFS8_ORYSI|nr:hypothetical protein OsI_32801 [Oryza sativa Indica Group]